MGRKRRKKKEGLRGLLPDISLDLELDTDQWLDILGYVLLTVAGLTLLSFLSANHGSVPRWWLRVLRQIFGWGAYLTPLLIGILGLWLVLRRFGDRLPRVSPLQAVGVALGYLGLLVTLHLLASLFLLHGDLQAIAEAGHGGGHLGAAAGLLLLRGLGVGGVVVVLGVGWFVILAITLEITLEDALHMLKYLEGRLRPHRLSPLPAGGEETTAEQPGEPPKEESPGKRVGPIMPTYEPAPPIIATAATSGDHIHPHVIGGDEQHRLPPLDDILDLGNDHDVSAAILREQARLIEETMGSLGAPVRVQEINHGPVVTQFGIEPLFIEKGSRRRRVKVSRITSRADDLALALEAKTVRFQTPIPGKKLIGLEVPNPESALVAMRDVIESEAFAAIDSSLRLALGQDVSGHPVVADLAKMPHLLIAGATGSGKSVCLNAIIAALLLQNTPDQLRLLMVDPKRVELTGYNGIPHLLAEVVVDMERVTRVLNWVLAEMDGRYRHFSETRASHIGDYNERVAPSIDQRPLPYIVVVVDELADLMMVAPHQAERSICRIAQMARATGIHMVIATQRPSVDVVTGLIKANFPARIAFNVASSVDSRVILDMAGAERLLSRGDMLYQAPDAPAPGRLQGTYVSDRELRRLVHYWKDEAKPKAAEPGKVVQKPLWDEMVAQQPSVEYEDELLPDVLELLLEESRASISLMQRRLRIGYTRAARIMDILERNDVVGPQPSGGRAREVFPEAARALLHPDGEPENAEDVDE
ncbi:MAG: DNA translocase FtsK [Anaerolineae bacterium]|jgi:S-DNA-T family DNA segregation ATPase FtsK/SpoIIIE